jgi:hypothetical protein
MGITRLGRRWLNFQAGRFIHWEVKLTIPYIKHPFPVTVLITVWFLLLEILVEVIMGRGVLYRGLLTWHYHFHQNFQQKKPHRNEDGYWSSRPTGCSRARSHYYEITRVANPCIPHSLVFCWGRSRASSKRNVVNRYVSLGWSATSTPAENETMRYTGISDTSYLIIVYTSRASSKRNVVNRPG